MKLALTINRSDIIVGILQELSTYCNQLLKEVSPIIKQLCEVKIEQAIKNEPTYSALQPGGILYTQIGNPNVNDDVESIINIIKSNILIDINPAKVLLEQIQCSITVNILKSDFSDILESSASSFRTQSGETINWLQWLLLEGDKPLVINYDFKMGVLESETGGILIPRQSKTWRIPEPYTGTAKSNWLTKAAAYIEPELIKIIETEFIKRAN